MLSAAFPANFNQQSQDGKPSSASTTPAPGCLVWVLAAMRAGCTWMVGCGSLLPGDRVVAGRRSPLLVGQVDLESDGMPVKVMAAFGALPAMIDAWS